MYIQIWRRSEETCQKCEKEEENKIRTTRDYGRYILIVIHTVYAIYFFIKSLILGVECVFKHQYLQRIDLRLNEYEQLSPS